MAAIMAKIALVLVIGTAALWLALGART